jgi:hypothetical protein
MPGPPGADATPPPPDAKAMPPSTPGDLSPNGAVTPGLKVGMAVKDNAGTDVGSVSEMKPDGTGRMFATVKMPEGAFAVDASSLQVKGDIATINMTRDQILAAIPKKQPG